MTEQGQPGSGRPAGADEVAARPAAPVSSGYPYPSPEVAARPAAPVSSGYPYPSPGQPAGGPPSTVAGWPPVAPAPREAAWRTERLEAVPGTPFGIAHLALRPVVSGLAIGALLTGIASILVSLLVLCFGISGSEEDWGGWVAGAFAVLAGVAGLAGVVIGLSAVRQIRRSNRPPTIRFTGRGLAISGISCGGVGLGITLLSLALALSLQLD